MATCPDCGEEIVAMVCGTDGAASPETVAAISAVIVAAHRHFGMCPAAEVEPVDG